MQASLVILFSLESHVCKGLVQIVDQVVVVLDTGCLDAWLLLIMLLSYPAGPLGKVARCRTLRSLRAAQPQRFQNRSPDSLSV